MLAALLGKNHVNINVLSELVNDSKWNEVTGPIRSKELVQKFVDSVSESNLFKKLVELRGLTCPVSVFIHHLEQPGARASWIIPVFKALEQEIEKWCSKASVRVMFDQETLDLVKSIVKERFVGSARKVGICAPHLVLAMLLDPCTFPGAENLPDNWHAECAVVWQKFFDAAGIMRAEAEMALLITGAGAFGEDVQRATQIVAEEGAANHGPLSAAIQKQKLSKSIALEAKWKVKYSPLFPNMTEVAVRLLSMATQSADVERCCKVHKIVHTKTRNRLKNKTVQMLVYCYVNLRLMNTVKSGINDPDCKNDLEDFLASAIESVEESDK